MPRIKDSTPPAAFGADQRKGNQVVSILEDSQISSVHHNEESMCPCFQPRVHPKICPTSEMSCDASVSWFLRFLGGKVRCTENLSPDSLQPSQDGLVLGEHTRKHQLELGFYPAYALYTVAASPLLLQVDRVRSVVPHSQGRNRAMHGCGAADSAKRGTCFHVLGYPPKPHFSPPPPQSGGFLECAWLTLVAYMKDGWVLCKIAL